MSEYLPDLPTLYYLCMALGIIAGSLGLGMLFGAMIRKGGGDKP